MPSWVSSSPDTGRRLLGVAAALVLALSLGACSAGPGATAPTLSGAWVRPPQGMDLPGAGYLVITGGSQADALLSASSPVAGSVEIHETSTAKGMSLEGAVPVEQVEDAAAAVVRAALDDDPPRDLATSRQGTASYALLRIAPRGLVDRLIRRGMHRNVKAGRYDSSQMASDYVARVRAAK